MANRKQSVATLANLPSTDDVGSVRLVRSEQTDYEMLSIHNGSSKAWGPIHAVIEQGPQGERGADGSTGSRGEQGLTGDTGAQGDAGASGAQGDTGATGADGATGAQGDPGPAPSGTGLVSVTAGVLDAASTLRTRVAADAANLRADLGLVISTNIQAYNATLTTWAGITPGTGVATALANAADGSSGFVTKSYADALVTGLLDFKGSTDASGSPNYPSASKGDVYYISVAGKIGGSSGKSVDIGDAVVASNDNAGGTEASVGISWFILEHNLTGAVLSGGALGTPSSGTLTNCTGLPAAGVTGTAAILGANSFTATQTILPAADNVGGGLRVNVSGGNPAVQIGALTSAATYGAIYLGNITPSATNYALISNAATTYLNGGTSITLVASSTNQAVISSNVFSFISSVILNWNGDLHLGREGAATLQLGQDAAGVTNQMLKSCDRITSDGVGGSLTIAGGRNRGASAGGSIIFQTSPAAGAGTTGTLADVLTLDSTKAAIFTGTVQTVVGTLASLGAAGTKGRLAFINDGSTTLILGLGLTAVGGGANNVPVYDDGANWIVG